MTWIKIEDQLPNEDEEVLTYSDLGICTAKIAWFDDGGKPYFMCKEDFHVKPTHWIKFPEGPGNGMD